MVKNCDISCSASNDRYLAGRRQTQFYDIRQCYVDKLARAFDERDWSSVTGAAEIDDAYNTCLAIVHQLIQQTIRCRKVTLTKYMKTSPHITPLVKSLLRRRNKPRRKGRIEAANELSQKICKLIEFRATQLQRLNSLYERYGDAFAALDQINQYFADIATDPNYDPDEITSIKPTTFYKNSGYTTCEYEVYKMLSTLKRTSPGIGGVPYWVYTTSTVLSNLHLF